MLKVISSIQKSIVQNLILWSSGSETKKSAFKLEPVNKVEQISSNTPKLPRYIITSAFNPTASCL